MAIMGQTHIPAIRAVLGPTNTGKTHLAIERLCAHSSGMMGFPLRLLAREVYERVVAIKGANAVALLTGEERIVPAAARYFLCTAESMPQDRDLAFVALDEAQLGADLERGHVFTDRLLHSRGREETMILGSATLKPALAELVPEAEIVSRPRFSALTYAGAKKLSRLPPRSAIVAFSAEEVYAVAEMIRRQRGGAAVVMGALSPRTRNAQVAMFQAGEVDYLVATDAIGMGLNLDIAHVAFASLTKYDGRRQRRLFPTEMAQIAGRAGRHHRDGTFGVMGSADGPNALMPEEIERIEQHHFAPISHLFWRNGEPDMASLDALIESLEARPDHPRLRAAPEAIDLAVAKRLAEDEAIRATLNSPAAVARFWAACGQPDFRKLGAEHHARFVERIWRHLSAANGHIPVPVFADALARLDNVQGDIETLSGRIAEIRSWAYIAHRADWLDDPAHWAGRTGEVEARLSDAMHERLTQRFVDRRTTALMRDIGFDADALSVTVADDGAVEVDGEHIGRLSGFRFQPDATARLTDKKMLIAAAEKRLGKELSRRAQALIDDSDSAFHPHWDEKLGWGIAWRKERVASLAAGKSWHSPRLRLDAAVARLALGVSIEQRLLLWVTAQSNHLIGALFRLETRAKQAQSPPPLRALFAALVEAGGVLPRKGNDALITALTPDLRRTARTLGIMPGALALFMPKLMKPDALGWITMLKQLQQDVAKLDGPWSAVPHFAFHGLGERGLRIDLAERIVAALHKSRTGRTPITPDRALATSLGMSDAEWQTLLRDAGFRPVDNGWSWRGQITRKPRQHSGSGHFDDLTHLVGHG